MRSKSRQWWLGCPGWTGSCRCGSERQWWSGCCWVDWCPASTRPLDRALRTGLVSDLEVAPGLRMMDTPDFPAAYLDFAKGHTAGLDTLRAAGETELDWLVVTPPMMLDQGERTGRCRMVGEQLLSKEDGTSHISYADLAIALIDEIDAPKHHRTRISVAD